MTNAYDTRIADLGIILPGPPPSVANYVAATIVGNILIVSGQLCLDANGKPVATGPVGVETSLEEATAAARVSAINILAQARAALGSLERVKQIVRLGGFIAAPAEFADHAKIMNGASDLMTAVFDQAGRHSRTTIGVASLPLRATVEIEAMIEIS